MIDKCLLKDFFVAQDRKIISILDLSVNFNRVCLVFECND